MSRHANSNAGVLCNSLAIVGYLEALFVDIKLEQVPGKMRMLGAGEKKDIQADAATVVEKARAVLMAEARTKQAVREDTCDRAFIDASRSCATTKAIRG